jgi:hypothetical protein
MLFKTILSTTLYKLLSIIDIHNKLHIFIKYTDELNYEIFKAK